jgi:hypothetical protein
VGFVGAGMDRGSCGEGGKVKRRWGVERDPSCEGGMVRGFGVDGMDCWSRCSGGGIRMSFRKFTKAAS